MYLCLFILSIPGGYLFYEMNMKIYLFRFSWQITIFFPIAEYFSFYRRINNLLKGLLVMIIVIRIMNL